MRNVCLRSLSHPILYGTLLYEICQDNWDIQYVIVHTRRKNTDTGDWQRFLGHTVASKMNVKNLLNGRKGKVINTAVFLYI